MTAYNLGPPVGDAAAMGLIVLQTDETLEHDFRRLFPGPRVAFYVSRVPSGADVTPETLAAMEHAIPAAAALLPPARRFDVVGYGCTSGATVIGPARVAELVHGAAGTGAVTDPMSAVSAALRHLKARRIGMLTPYIPSVTAPMRAALEEAGFTVADLVSFDEAEEVKVARIDGPSIIAAVGGMQEVDAIFLSCTNLQTLDVIEPIEAQLGVPVISSNTALAWHMAQLGRVHVDGAVGRLLVGDGGAGGAQAGRVPSDQMPRAATARA